MVLRSQQEGLGALPRGTVTGDEKSDEFIRLLLLNTKPVLYINQSDPETSDRLGMFIVYSQVSLWCPPSPPPSGMFDYASINVKFGSGTFGKLADTRHRHGLERHQESGAEKRKKKRQRDDARGSLAADTLSRAVDKHENLISEKGANIQAYVDMIVTSLPVSEEKTEQIRNASDRDGTMTQPEETILKGKPSTDAQGDAAQGSRRTSRKGEMSRQQAEPLMPQPMPDHPYQKVGVDLFDCNVGSFMPLQKSGDFNTPHQAQTILGPMGWRRVLSAPLQNVLSPAQMLMSRMICTNLPIHQDLLTPVGANKVKVVKQLKNKQKKTTTRKQRPCENSSLEFQQEHGRDKVVLKEK
ncbi:hypothetical protein QQF64_002652 [Cirrhinus molitorella]|uniref:Uncharacterized protein n=1 Tax=Cirrhinus molitorella TaxID=172907 RepID=A0ABR3MQU5_9TELE